MININRQVEIDKAKIGRASRIRDQPRRGDYGCPRAKASHIYNQGLCAYFLASKQSQAHCFTSIDGCPSQRYFLERKLRCACLPLGRGFMKASSCRPRRTHAYVWKSNEVFLIWASEFCRLATPRLRLQEPYLDRSSNKNGHALAPIKRIRSPLGVLRPKSSF